MSRNVGTEKLVKGTGKITKKVLNSVFDKKEADNNSEKILKSIEILKNTPNMSLVYGINKNKSEELIANINKENNVSIFKKHPVVVHFYSKNSVKSCFFTNVSTNREKFYPLLNQEEFESGSVINKNGFETLKVPPEKIIEELKTNLIEIPENYVEKVEKMEKNTLNMDIYAQAIKNTNFERNFSSIILKNTEISENTLNSNNFDKKNNIMIHYLNLLVYNRFQSFDYKIYKDFKAEINGPRKEFLKIAYEKGNIYEKEIIESFTLFNNFLDKHEHMLLESREKAVPEEKSKKTEVQESQEFEKMSKILKKDNMTVSKALLTYKLENSDQDPP